MIRPFGCRDCCCLRELNCTLPFSSLVLLTMRDDGGSMMALGDDVSVVVEEADVVVVVLKNMLDVVGVCLLE